MHYNLKQEFYLNACQIEVKIDVDKVFDQFSAAVSADGFLGIDNISLAKAYEKTITSGAISTKITMNNAVVDEALKKMIDTQVDEMRKFAIDQVKKDIFDFIPKPDTAASTPASTPASTSRGLFSSLFGNVSVSMKKNYQRKSLKLTQTFELNGSIALFDTKSGDLNDLEPEIRQHLDKYLAVVDVGDAFQKLQVASTNNINWNETLPDGTKLNDPIIAAQIEVGYPNFGSPMGANNRPNPQFRAQGFHYVTGHKDTRPAELARWDKDNGKEIINIAFLKLAQSLPAWDVDEVIVRKTIVYDPSDPRLELANGGSTFVTEMRTKGHAPVITPDEVGYIFVRFLVNQKIPDDLLRIRSPLPARSDRAPIHSKSPRPIRKTSYGRFFDKFIHETSATYELEVTVVGPDFTDPPVVYKSAAPTKIDLQPGRLKYVPVAKIVLPTASADQVATINRYIKAAS